MEHKADSSAMAAAASPIAAAAAASAATPTAATAASNAPASAAVGAKSLSALTAGAKSLEPAPILALSPSVVNRIAAGEVIHRPASALKELLENSIDAGATKISIQLRDGGLHTLQIQDNGHGIRKEDFPILCERFTTSKLSAYEDLQSIATFGFRGEALASMTHVARVAITSMTRGSACAWRAHFQDGKMVAPPGSAAADSSAPVAPKACAGIQGTLIQMEDLFWNVPIRRNALKNASGEEYARCIDMLCKYAVHYSGVAAISCKKVGANKMDLNTPLNASIVDNIRAIYGAAIAKELLPLELRLDSKEACAARGLTDCSSFSITGHISNANCSQKKLGLLLFINHRLVDSTLVRRVVETTYARYLPKQTHPWCYLSLSMDPRILDVNVHPTKKEVAFLSEEAVAALLEEAMEKTLKGANKSRVFYASSIEAGGGVAGGEGFGREVPPARSSAAAAAMDLSGDGGREAHEEKSYLAASSSEAAAAAASPMQLEEGEEDLMPVAATSALGASAAAAAAAAGGVRLSQPSLPSAYRPASASGPFSAVRAPSQSQSQSQPRRDNALIRTDNRQGKMDSFFAAQSQPQMIDTVEAPAAAGSSGRKRAHAELESEETVDDGAAAAAAPPPVAAASYPSAGRRGSAAGGVRPPVQILLTSVQNLIGSVVSRSHPQLHDLFKGHTFVGYIEAAYSLVQFKTKLYLLNMSRLSRAFFYETVLKRFGHHPIVRFSGVKGVPIERMIRMAMEHPSQRAHSANQTAEQKDDLAAEYTNLLVSRAAMLKEYFALDISVDDDSDESAGSAVLLGLPELIESYNPPLLLLPLFLLKLARDSVWDEEQRCFESIAHAIADFYYLREQSMYVEKQQTATTAASSSAAAAAASAPLPPLSWFVPHVLLPAFRHRVSFSPPAHAANDGTVTQIASLENLYKIFERC